MSDTLPLSHAEAGSAGVLSGRFHRSTRLDESDVPPESRRGDRARQAGRPRGDPLPVRPYADNVYGYVASIVKDEHEAEDITQLVFAKLMTVIGKYEQRKVPFTSWLLRLAHNAALDHLRRPGCRPPPKRFATPDGAHTGRARLSPRGARRPSRRSQTLSQPRTVVVLRHVIGLTPREIAEHLGRSENAIHGLHHRGRRALQSQLRELECVPAIARKCAAA